MPQLMAPTWMSGVIRKIFVEMAVGDAIAQKIASIVKLI
jgi:hypothetical protein